MVDRTVAGGEIEAFELDELERRIGRLTHQWIARLAGELEELGVGDSARAAQRAGEAAQVLDGLGRALEGAERIRGVLR